MGPGNRLASWLGAIGRWFGFRALDGLDQEQRSNRRTRGTPESKPGCPHHRSQVDAEARRLIANYRGSTPHLTAGELAKRAERRLHLVGK